MQSLFFIAAALIQFTIGNPIDAKGASQSPGFASGNVIQAPLNVPINACGNTVDVIGVLNPAFGNTCTNTSDNV
jgi:hypothetical protein